MKVKGKKFISLFLVLSLLSVNCATIREALNIESKPGAYLIIQKTDGQLINGELIAVKKNSLLMLDSNGADTTIYVNEIRAIHNGRNSNPSTKKKAMIWGAVIGGVCGAVIVGGFAEANELENSLLIALGGGAVGALAGLLIGFIIGTIIEKYESTQFEGLSEAEKKNLLKKLQSKARVKNFQ